MKCLSFVRAQRACEISAGWAAAPQLATRAAQRAGFSPLSAEPNNSAPLPPPQPTPSNFARSPYLSPVVVFGVMCVLLLSSPAFAQNLESKVQNLGTLVINILSVVAVLVGTAASLIAGMKYMGGDPHAREQVKGIAIGAFFAFAAAGIVQAMRGALA